MERKNEKVICQLIEFGGCLSGKKTLKIAQSLLFFKIGEKIKEISSDLQMLIFTAPWGS